MEQATMITLTPKAAEKARLALDGQDDAVLRMGVRGGGCSGFQYALTVDRPQEGDVQFEQHGLKVAVAGDAVPYLKGSVLDYEDGLIESGFKFDNPNATAACGCGSSFRVDDQQGCDSEQGEGALDAL